MSCTAKLGGLKYGGPCCGALPARFGMWDGSYFSLVSLPPPPSPVSIECEWQFQLRAAGAERGSKCAGPPSG